ncbi:MAG: hypothetical protein JWR10_3651 [Rubritepida sp.]|nr:hypothetical protein [Rubritepida sp.]
MAANMREPKPADPLYWRLHDTLSVRCLRCSNKASGTVHAWVVWHRLSDKIRLRDMQLRMVCLRCNEYAPEMSIEERR